MSSILFLGYSNLVKRRILPIVQAAGFDNIYVAKYSGQSWDVDLPDFVTHFDSLEEGIEKYQGSLVYISIVNSRHVEYAKKCFEARLHTIIDKPATLSLSEAECLIELAKSKNLLLAESTVYLEHPQMEVIQQIFKENDDSPKLITMHFSMPPFIGDNFRYHKDLGGGAINDTAPYVASLGRYFFKAVPVEVRTSINERQKDGLEIEYSTILKYADGKCLLAHAGFNTEYINQALVMGRRTNILVNRIFTIPDTMENVLRITHENVESQRVAPKGNTFSLFLQRIHKALCEQSYEPFYQSLLMDAKTREMIQNSII